MKMEACIDSSKNTLPQLYSAFLLKENQGDHRLKIPKN